MATTQVGSPWLAADLLGVQACGFSAGHGVFTWPDGRRATRCTFIPIMSSFRQGSMMANGRMASGMGRASRQLGKSHSDHVLLLSICQRIARGAPWQATGPKGPPSRMAILPDGRTRPRQKSEARFARIASRNDPFACGT